MTIQFEISDNLYKCLKKRIELGIASEIDMLVDKGTVIEPKTDGDCIGRKAALDIDFDRICLTTAKPAEMIRNRIKDLPPVQPKAKTGYWREHECEELRKKGYYRCSVCNHGYQRFERGVRKSDVPYINGQPYELHHIDNYCPNCGSRMKESEENECSE